MENKIVLQCLTEVCNELLAKKEELNALDAVMGDGEHGSNIERTFGQVQKQLSQMEQLNGAQVIDQTGSILLAAGGGTATTLMGFACKKTGILLKGKENPTAAEVAEVMQKVMGSIQKKSQAIKGDKTLMDAYLPAVEGFVKASGEEKTLKECFAEAAKAAAKGADETKNMIAKRGRGYYVGERGLGTADPGAISVATIFHAISKMLEEGE